MIWKEFDNSSFSPLHNNLQEEVEEERILDCQMRHSEDHLKFTTILSAIINSSQPFLSYFGSILPQIRKRLVLAQYGRRITQIG